MLGVDLRVILARAHAEERAAAAVQIMAEILAPAHRVMQERAAAHTHDAAGAERVVFRGGKNVLFFKGKLQMVLVGQLLRAGEHTAAEPRKIVVCSSAPQIRYPDCYGIDMSRLGDFVAFRAAVELLRESGRQTLIDDVYRECLEQLQGERSQAANCVKRIYEPFTDEQISAKIAQIIKAPDIRSQVEVIYQTVPNMHEAIPAHGGDWYFTGDYPTPGGNAVADQAFVNFYEKRNERAY